MPNFKMLKLYKSSFCLFLSVPRGSSFYIKLKDTYILKYSNYSLSPPQFHILIHYLHSAQSKVWKA